MFKSVRSRYALRVSIMATLAGLGALKASIGDGLDAAEIVDIVEITLAAGAAYAGIGAAFKQVEPSIGNKSG